MGILPFWSKPQLIYNDCRDKGYGNFVRYYYRTAAANNCPSAMPPGVTSAPNASGPAGPTIGDQTSNDPNTTRGGFGGDSRMWQSSDFAGSKMPTQLDGVSVTVNGKAAYVYYISPAQINVLTPPDSITGAVQIVVTNNGAVSTPFSAQAQALSPSFFVFTGEPYILAVHSSGALVGPVTLYPGATPAIPGETISLFANGFGPTSMPVASGALMQGGMLTPQPVIQINGITATIQYAALVAPGEFQFNVVVPPDTPDGDQSITATYNGLSTQAGALLAVQH